MTKINIAIDGYAGCGKSTLARDVAKELGYQFIDTGALYRGITHFVSTDIDINVSELSESMVTEKLRAKPSLAFQAKTNHLLLNGEDVETQIRSAQTASRVSTVAAMQVVREYLLELQQSFIENKGVVMEGRDIGTVIMPNAEMKLFVTANMTTRVERRYLQLLESGKEQSREEVLENLTTRDQQDASRTVAPLKKAQDAIAIDTSMLTREEQVKLVVSIANPMLDSKGLLPFV